MSLLFILQKKMRNQTKKSDTFRPNPDARLMDQVKEVLRYYHYAFSTEKSYCQWILRYIYFYGGKTHPKKLGTREVERFLSHLTLQKKVSNSTQQQALNALVFLYNRVLGMSLEGQIQPVRNKRRTRIPTVMTQEEVRALFVEMDGQYAFMAKLIYGGGLRLMECLRLRIQDIDLGQGLLFIRGGKGGKDRTTLLAKNLHKECCLWLDNAKQTFHQDQLEGFGEVYIPEALARKYRSASRSVGWQWFFPARKRSVDPRSGKEMRHHVNQSGLQKAVKRAAQRSGIAKKVGCHTLRHSFATHMLEKGVNIRVLQELLGHADVKTTEVYTHVLKQNVRKLESPLDQLF